MVGSCPNRNSEDWKRLLNQVGEDLAEKAFIANGYIIPNVPTISEIKKDIGYRKQRPDYTVPQFAKQLKKYNQKNGTSHSFTPKLVFGDTVEITMHLNYIPVNIEKQRQKDSQRLEPAKVANNEQAEKAFRELYEIEPGKFQQEATGVFDDEGNFKVPDDIDEDYLVETASEQVKAVEQKRKLKIDRDIYSLREQMLKAQREGNKDEVYRLGQEINKLKNTVENAERRLTLSDKITSFEEITGSDSSTGFAEKQLQEVDNILSKENITYDDINYSRRVIDLWLKAGDFTGDSSRHIILDEEEFNTPEIREKFQALKNIAENLDTRLFRIEKDLVVDLVRDYTGANLTAEEIYKDLADIGKLASNTLWLGRLPDEMIKTIASTVERANTKAKLEVNEVWKDIETLGKKAMKKSDNFQMYRQKTEDGNYTGKMVDRFAPEFYSEKAKLWNKAFNQKDAQAKVVKDPTAIKNYFDWLNKNTINFDPRALFPDSLGEDEITPDKYLYTSVTFEKKAIEDHIITLKSHLGEKGYQQYYDLQERRIEKFKVQRDIVYTSLLNENISPEEIEVRMEDWLKENSPYWGTEMLTNPSIRKTGNTYYKPTGLQQYGVTVPRKTIDNQETKWYDKNYQKIEADEDLYNFHKYVMDLMYDLNKTLPYSKRQLMERGVLPMMEKSIMDLFTEKGMGIGITPFFDKFKELQTTTELSTNISNDVNPLTGEQEKQINVAFVKDFGPEVESRVKVLKLKYEQATGKIATITEINEFRKQAVNEVANQQSWDLIKVLKAYSLTTLAHKHKAEIDPQIKLLTRAFSSRNEIETNRSGESRTKWGKKATKEGLAEWQDAINFYLDAEHYSIGARKVEGVSKTKLYSKEEKARKKEIEELITNEKDEEKKEILQEELDKLGNFRTLSASFDTMLKYMVYKNLGWNLGSSFSNLGFGFISNLTQASDGREFNLANMRKAYMLTINSVGRNLSFNSWEGVNQNGLKIRTIMDKWHLMNTSNNEMFQTSTQGSIGKLKRFAPMTLQERTEYLNYAPVMIATLMEFKATNPQGEETTLWEAFDHNGEIKEGYKTDFDEVKLIQRIKRSIEATHGDYNNPLKIKRTVAGRAVTQFRTWMFEGFANRFEAEKPDYDLSYGMSETYIRKGRYKSYTQGQLSVAGAALGTTFLPGVGTILGAGGGYLVGKFFGLQTKENTLADTLFTLKQLARKMVFQKTNFDSRFDKVDAANMRKNMTELYVLMSVAGLALLIRASIDDEEKKKDVKVANFLLNQMTRLHTDITFYTNPTEAEKLTQTAVPMAKLVDEVGTWFMDVAKLFDDDHENDEFQAPSPFEGYNKAVVHGARLIPPFSAVVKLAGQVQKTLE
jgi:hypothetical protein